MPFLLRIAIQRILLVVYSTLAFVGVAPEPAVPNAEEARVAIEDRQKVIQDFLQNKDLEDFEIQQDINKAEKDLLKIPQEKIGPETFPKIEKVSTPKTNTEKIRPLIETVQETFQEPIKEIYVPELVLNTKDPQDLIVNIVCTRKFGNKITASTGSGVIISSKGTVITNAHVGQFVLLEDELGKSFMDCALYQENIPTFGYRADVLYISPDWIMENKNLISAANPRGTGENDYAILQIIGNTNPSFTLPSKFPYINFATENIFEIDDKVRVAGYPGAPSNLLDIAKAGTLRSENARIIDIFTFGENTADVFSVSESSVGARGASGGGIIKDDNLIGIIVTTNDSSGNSEINALSTEYVNRDLKKDTGNGISYYLSGDLAKIAEDFSKDFGKNLARILESEF